MVRAVTRNLWRQFFPETDDPTLPGEDNPTVGDLPLDPLNDQRFKRLVARTFREQQQEIAALEARIAALENV